MSGSTTRRTHMVNNNNVVDRSAPIRSEYPNQIPLVADQYAALPQVEVPINQLVGHKHDRKIWNGHVLRWELRIVILKNQSSQKMRFLRINIMRTLILKNQHFSELWFLRIILWLLMLILKNQHFMRTLILKNHSFCERWFLRITLFYT